MTKKEVDVVALARLARLEVSAEELTTLEREIPEILVFVEIVQRAHTGKKTNTPALRNVMRTDDEPHGSGAYTERLLEAAPAREGSRIAVKQVVSRKSAQGGSTLGRK